MSKDQEFFETGRILAIERLKNSASGNPTYQIIYEEDDGEMTGRRTGSDISDAYEVGNPGYRAGDRVRFQIDGRGHIARMTKI